MPPDERKPALKGGLGRGFGEGYSYVALGFSFAFAILVFGALGWVVDGWLHTRPLFALVGAALGGFGGFMSIYYRVQRDTEPGKREGGRGKGKA
ncbi:MAG TPA: AtpZ/AtpI family protein [Myxococcaceae bacterium]|jgi:F0F1-type ATP synthase assembly protein I|nr:AtpZ/AtpI family protein [Myxococcaceae bacterium]